MNNYEYIIAGLPVYRQDSVKPENFDADALIDEITELCGRKDAETISLLLSTYDADKLNAELYASAARSGNAFIREYFEFDRRLRNEKARYLNGQLGRALDQDTIVLDPEEGEYDGADEIKSVLGRSDLLEREKGLDDLYWRKSEELITGEVFSLDVILAFIVRLKILDRWFRLDPKRGKQLFENLIREIRKTTE